MTNLMVQKIKHCAFRVALSLIAFLGLISETNAQTENKTFKLANSTWPIFHANTHATKSSPASGPGPVDSFQKIGSLTDRRVRKPSVSPWTVVAEPYADGSQAIITTPNDGVAKYLIKDKEFREVDFLKLERNSLDFDWGILLLDGGLGIVTEKKHNRFVVFGDVNPSPDSRLEVKWRIPIDENKFGKLSAHFSLAPDGHLIALTFDAKLIAVDLNQNKVVSWFDLPTNAGTSFHNSFPIDERGRIYLTTQNMMISVDWTGEQFKLAWKAEYDMRGPGCEDVPLAQSRFREAYAVARGKPCTGSGTTPTIIGDRESGIVFIVDGHAPKNNLVAFWRDSPPSDWKPLEDPTKKQPHLDRQVAGVFPLPYSTPEGDGFTAENSPAALGNSIIVAQWAGFRPEPNAPKGVQRVDWKPEKRQFELVWANPAVHFNGVPSVACAINGSCYTYGMGRYKNGYLYKSLDFETGAVAGEINLGVDNQILDQGNNHAVAADGSIIYSGRTTMVRVK